MRIVGNPPSGGKKPTTPTIGTATDGGTGTTVSVAFTPSTYIGKGTITYTATSSPGSLTASGSGSPLTVSGLTTGTAYTFTVAGNTNYGVASDSSAASNSVTPASPSSYESIATFTGNGSASTYTFSSISSTYKSLQLRILARTGNAGTATAIYVRPNSDSGFNYTYHVLSGDGSSTSSTGQGTGSLDGWVTPSFAARNGQTAGIFGGAIIDIIDYASTSKYKTMRAFSGLEDNGAGGSKIGLSSNLWLSTSAINSLTIFSLNGNFSTGTSIALYGIKG